MVSEEDQKTIRGIAFPTNALALIVQTELKLDPHSGVTVVFRSKRGDRLKILVWVSHVRATGPSERRSGRHWFESTGARRKTGMVRIYKVLEQGSFAWPKVQDGVMSLCHAQFEALLVVSKTRLRHDGP